MTPTDILEEEHRLIERAIHVAAITADNLNQHESLPTGLLRRIVEFMQRYVRDYHQMKEDSILFELLERKGVSERGCPLAPIRNEHQKIRTILAELSDAAIAYETSHLEAERAVESLTSLTEIYPHHLWIENFLLFPMTNKLLNADEQALLGQRLHDADAARALAAHDEMIRAIEDLESAARTLRPRPVSQVPVQAPAGPQRAPEPMRGAAIQFNLLEEVARLRQEPAWEHGRNTKTLIEFPDLRVVLTAIRAGQTLTDHRGRGRTYIQTLSGHIRVEALGKTVDLPVDHIIALDREVPHHIVSLEDSTFIVVVVWAER